jgi:protein tyrosine kinase modulator
MSATSGMREMGNERQEPEKANRSVDLARIRAVWSRRKWLAILVFAGPFAATTTVILSVPSLYRSTATVLVERQQVPESFVRTTVTSELETRLQTISQKILSRSRLEELIDRFQLYADLRHRMPSEGVAERMRRDITLEIKATGRQSGTVAFALSYLGRDPQTVALITNTLAGFYVDENLKAREQQATGTAEFLKAQLTAAKKRLEEQERHVSEFRKRYLGELPEQMQANLATLESLTTQLRLNSDNRARAVERQEALASQISEAASPGPALGALPGVPPGPEPAAVHLARLRQELTAARARYTDTHPTIARLKDEITALEREQAEVKPEAAGEAAATHASPPSPYVLRLREALHAADGELKILRVEEQRLRSAITVYQARVESTPRREQEFQDISRDYESTKELHRSLLKRYEEAQLAETMEQRQKGEQFRVLDPAMPSAVTAAPSRPRLLLMALMLSLGLAAGAVMAAEMVDTSFHSADELRAFTTVPVLASISRISTEADRRRGRQRFRLSAAGALLGLALVVGTSYVIGHGNEQLVRVLDRDRAS